MTASVRILLLMIILLTGGMAPAYAQTLPTQSTADDDAGRVLPQFRTLSKGDTIDAPDWAQDLSKAPPSKDKNEDAFYQRCLLSGDPSVAQEQRELCSCMAAHKAVVDNAPHDAYWVNQIHTRLINPYETFVSKIYAPCMYLQAHRIGLNECYHRTQFQMQFATNDDFDDYCECYAESAERYMNLYGEPAMTAMMASIPAYAEKNEPIDPMTMMTSSTDYRDYLEKSREKCTKMYGMQPASTP